MIYNSKEAEQAAVTRVAQSMCAAARTAPKTRGIDYLHTCVVTADDLTAVANEMDRLSETLGYAFFMRDADNVRASQAIVLIGSSYNQRGLGEGCRYCNFENCEECAEKNGVCVYDQIDLGIALGSAVGIAADSRIDSRVMFSVGKAALSLGLFDESVKIAMGIPLCALGKSPYFDRTPK